MKTNILLIIIFIAITFKVCSQTEKDLYFTSKFEPAGADEATYHICIKPSGKKKYQIRTYEKKHFQWNAIDEEIVQDINDSTILVIKNQRSIKIKHTRILTLSNDS